MATAITIDELSKVYTAAQTRTAAVDGISLNVRPGEMFFLLGPSGCGKTTLLRMIAGFIEPTSGRVLFDGRDVTKVAANRRNTGMVFQSYALWPHMTVEANVAFGLDVRRVPAAERARRVADALDAVRMREFARRRPNELSGGQQQRVALARALVIRPDVLLLDEPLSNLDAKLRTELRAEIRRICKEYPSGSGLGITTIYVTHDQKEALSMADQVAIIDRGRIVQLGSPSDLYRRPATTFVAEFLGETNFIEGKVAEHAGGRTVVETALGRLVSEHPVSEIATNQAEPWKPGQHVRCSIRPEALRLRGSGADTQETNRFEGVVIEATYLGESLQQVVESAGLRIKNSVLNPAGATLSGGYGARVELQVAPNDVILLRQANK